MIDSENQVSQFILERVPYFAYEKYYMAFFKGKAEAPPSVWISVVINDWKDFRNGPLNPKEESPLAKKMDQFCDLLQDFMIKFKSIHDLNRSVNFQKIEWLKIVEFARNIYN